jgi:hypothetical protein
MEFLVINKSLTPPKVSRVTGVSMQSVLKSLKGMGIDEYELYLNINDDDLSALFERVADLEKRVQRLEPLAGREALAPSVQPLADHRPNADAPSVHDSQGPKAVRIQLLRKELVSARPQAGVYGDRLVFAVRMDNLTGKSVRAVKGEVVFSDLFDSDIFRVPVTVNEKIEPRSSVEWEWEMTYNKFIPAHVHFAGFKPEDLKVRMEEESVAFA